MGWWIILTTIGEIILGLLCVVATVPYGLLWVYDHGIAAWSKRRRVRSILRSGGTYDIQTTFSEHLDRMWRKVHLPGTPFEWLIGSIFGVLLASAAAQALFNNWVLDVGLPIDCAFLVFFVVQRTRQANYNRLMGQMSTAFHIVATEYNVRKHVGAALTQAHPRLPKPVSLLFEPTVKLMNSGVAPIHALVQLGHDLGPPYGDLFSRTLQQGLTSTSIDKLLVHVATMTEEWNVARKQASATVVMPQLIGMALNGGFYVVAYGVRYILPQIATYEGTHPLLFVPGVISVAAGLLLASRS